MVDMETLRSRIQAASKLRPKMDDDEPEAESAPEPDKEELWKDGVARLRQAHALLCQTTDFKVGDIVQWKDGLRNMEHPGNNRPALVTDVLKRPVEIRADEGSSHFREFLTLKVMVAVDDRTCVEFHVDGRRFQKGDGS